MRIDILLCIDGTSSMKNVISDVKKNIISFVNNLLKKLDLDSTSEVTRVRLKFVVFRNADFDESMWYQESPFYDLKKSRNKISQFFERIKARGGVPGENVEDGLMAFSNALSSANWDSRRNDIQVIGIWTDASSKKIVPGHPELKEGAPESFEQLKEYWINTSEASVE